MLLRALVNCIEVLGEAAAHVGEEMRAATPDIPWRAIVAMRNRLIHAYFDINKDVVWSTVTHDLALLEPQLTAFLGPDEAGP
jgi:uncharacterized protein with HEPN domain